MMPTVYYIIYEIIIVVENNLTGALSIVCCVVRLQQRRKRQRGWATRRVWSAPGDDAPGPLRVGSQGARLLHPLLRAGEEKCASGQRDARLQLYAQRREAEGESPQRWLTYAA